MVDTGGAQGLVGLLADKPALARDERRRDRAGLSADGLSDPAGEIVAGLVDGCGETKAQIRWNRRGFDLDAPGQRADCPDPAKIGVAGEIIAARPGRFGWR